MTQHIDKTVIINASPPAVWEALTDIDEMKAWMAEPELDFVLQENYATSDVVW